MDRKAATWEGFCQRSKGVKFVGLFGYEKRCWTVSGGKKVYNYFGGGYLHLLREIPSGIKITHLIFFLLKDPNCDCTKRNFSGRSKV